MKKRTLKRIATAIGLTPMVLGFSTVMVGACSAAANKQLNNIGYTAALCTGAVGSVVIGAESINAMHKVIDMMGDD